MQNIFKISIALLIVSLVAACGAKKKEVTAEDRRQAAQAAGEALFANTLKNPPDYAAAEKALTRATTLNPLDADYWFDLGIARARLKDKSGARTAFKNVISVCADKAKEDPNNATWLIKQIRPMIMLGRDDDARAILEKAAKQFPTDLQVRQFKDLNLIDTLLKDPLLKEFAL
jgi:Flp pilus assembly protein TadD